MLIYAPKALTHKQREYAKHPRKKICRRAENTIGTTHYHFIPENPCNQHHNRKWFADLHKQKLTQVQISNFHTCTSTLAKQKANSCPTSMNRVSEAPFTFILSIHKLNGQGPKQNPLLGLGHVADQVDNTVAVTPFVVVPRDKLDEVVVQSNPSLGVKDARPKEEKSKRNGE
jgi:hypothetical protein